MIKVRKHDGSQVELSAMELGQELQFGEHGAEELGRILEHFSAGAVAAGRRQGKALGRQLKSAHHANQGAILRVLLGAISVMADSSVDRRNSEAMKMARAIRGRYEELRKGTSL